MAVVTFFFLPDSPEKARSLNEDEKRIAKLRGVRQEGHEKRIGGLSWKDVGLALMDVKNWLTAVSTDHRLPTFLITDVTQRMYFSCNASFSSLPVFLPTILNEMGFKAADAQGLTAPPFFLSFCITIGSTYLADKWQQRGLVIICLSAVGCIGYILIAATKSVGSRYTGCFLAAAGIFPSIANILPWVMNNQGSDTRRGTGIFLLNVIGQCGPILGTRLYPAAEGPFYVKGRSLCAAFMGFTTLLALALRTLLAGENKQLDAHYGTLEEQKLRREQLGEDPKSNHHVAAENYGPEYWFVL